MSNLKQLLGMWLHIHAVGLKLSHVSERRQMPQDFSGSRQPFWKMLPAQEKYSKSLMINKLWKFVIFTYVVGIVLCMRSYDKTWIPKTYMISAWRITVKPVI